MKSKWNPLSQDKPHTILCEAKSATCTTILRTRKKHITSQISLCMTTIQSALDIADTRRIHSRKQYSFFPTQEVMGESSQNFSGHVATHVRSHMNGLIPFERTIDQTTETTPPCPKTVTAANNEENYKLTRAATLPIFFHLTLTTWWTLHPLYFTTKLKL